MGAAQRAWAAKHRAAAAADPKKYESVRIKSSIDRARIKKEATQKLTAGKAAATSKGVVYRGPTAEQIAAKTLEASTSTIAHRLQARETALTQSGVRAGMTQVQSTAEATKAVYGIKSARAQAAQVALKKEWLAVKRGIIPPNAELPLTSTQIHQREMLYGGAERETLLEALKGKAGEIQKYQIAPLEKKIRRQNLQLQSLDSKLQTQSAQLNILENRLNNYPITDGVFTGSEKQFLQYKKYHTAYVNKFNQVDKSITNYNNLIDNTESKITQKAGLDLKAQRAKYGGLAGKYEEAERKTAEKLKEEKAEFEEKHPVIVAQSQKLYKEFKKIAESKVVGPTPSGFGKVTKMADPTVVGLQLDEQSIDAVVALSKREGFKGIVQQAGQKPIKTAAMVGVGIVTPPVFRGIGAVAKAAGAGRKVAIAGKVGLYGMAGMYVVGTGIKYTQAGTPYERGAVLGEAIFQESIPLFVGGYIGTKAITAAPSITKAIIRKGKLTTTEFKIGSRAMLEDTKAATHMSFGKTKKQKLEDAIKLMEAKKGEPLTNTEIKILEKTFGTTRLKSAEQVHETRKAARLKEEAEIKRKLASGEYKKVKIGTGAQQQIQLVKMKPKVLTEQSLKDITKLKKEFELITKPVVKQKVVQKPVQKVKVLTDAQKAESLRLKQQATQKQAAYQKEMQALADQMPSFKRKVVVKTVQKQVLKDKSITKQIIELKQQYKKRLITKQVYEQKLARLNKQKTKVVQQQKQTLKQAQKTVAMAALILTPKPISDVTTLIDSVQETKLKAIQIPKLKPRVAAKPKKKIKPVQKVVPKQVPKRVTKPKPPMVAKPPKVPKMPPVPSIKRKAKKKPIEKKPTQYIIYNPTQLENRVATLQSLFG